VRTLVNLQNIPTGFNERNAMLFEIDTATTGLTKAPLGNMLVDIENRVRQLPGIEAASFSFLTFNKGAWTSPIFTADDTPPKGDGIFIHENIVGADYFKAMGIPMVGGRVFNANDDARAHKVAVVSETLARHFYPAGDAIGKHFGERDDQRNEYEIVGIVKDVKYQSLTEKARGVAYFSIQQFPMPASNFVVRTSVDPQTVTPAIRRVLREVNTNLPVDDVVSFEEHIARSLVQQKLIARLATFFGLLALLLASIGLYGVLSYSVARRRNEIGIRIALGASRLDVIKMVLRSGMTLTLIGVVLGVGGALGLSRVVKVLLFGVESNDTFTFVAVSIGLVVVALVACYIPARRATHVDPLTALRSD
jgi:predicted permease